MRSVCSLSFLIALFEEIYGQGKPLLRWMNQVGFLFLGHGDMEMYAVESSQAKELFYVLRVLCAVQYTAAKTEFLMLAGVFMIILMAVRLSHCQAAAASVTHIHEPFGMHFL